MVAVVKRFEVKFLFQSPKVRQVAHSMIGASASSGSGGMINTPLSDLRWKHGGKEVPLH